MFFSQSEKDVHYASYAKGEFEREHDYLKEKISIPVRDSINIEDIFRDPREIDSLNQVIDKKLNKQ